MHSVSPQLAVAVDEPVTSLQAYQPVAKVVTAFDRPCTGVDGVAMGAHTPGMRADSALSGGRRNGLGARGTFTTGCYALGRPLANQQGFGDRMVANTA